MLSQCRNNFEEACVAKWKKQELSWLLVNINELIENLVSEVRHSFEISLPSWPFVGPASLFRLAYWGVCYCEPCFSSFMCADRRLTLVYYQECLGILIIYWISTRQKKIANHSEIINLTYSFPSFTTKGIVFISDHGYIVIINKLKSNFY